MRTRLTFVKYCKIPSDLRGSVSIEGGKKGGVLCPALRRKLNTDLTILGQLSPCTVGRRKTTPRRCGFQVLRWTKREKRITLTRPRLSNFVCTIHTYAIQPLTSVQQTSLSPLEAGQRGCDRLLTPHYVRGVSHLHVPGRTKGHNQHKAMPSKKTK